MSLPEAVDLFWPEEGAPITETTLRTAIKNGRLPISRIAGKIFVNKIALGALEVCVALTPAPASCSTDTPDAVGDYLEDLRAIEAMGSRSK